MRSITYREALREAIREEMATDERVFILGEDVGKPFGGVNRVTQDLWKEFGEERVRNTPISENTFIGAALGAALLGMRPIAEIMYFDFITLAIDQIVNQIAKTRYMYGGQVKIPLVIRTNSGPGQSAAAQHSQCLESWFVHIPGLKVIIPSNAYTAKGLLKASIRDDNPIIFVEHKFLYNSSDFVPEKEFIYPIGKARIVKEGRDITIIAIGIMVSKALSVASQLEKENVSVEVIDLLTLFPLDTSTIFSSVRKTGKLVITHEAVSPCGIGAEIAALVVKNCFEYLKAPIERVTSKFAPYAFAPELQNYVMPKKEDIFNSVIKLIRFNK